MKLTKEGHHPGALMMICTALAPHVGEAEAFHVGTQLFSTLHDAGMRFVPVESLPVQRADDA